MNGVEWLEWNERNGMNGPEPQEDCRGTTALKSAFSKQKVAPITYMEFDGVNQSILWTK